VELVYYSFKSLSIWKGGKVVVRKTFTDAITKVKMSLSIYPVTQSLVAWCFSSVLFRRS
jgi:hypothetical protein